MIQYQYYMYYCLLLCEFIHKLTHTVGMTRQPHTHEQEQESCSLQKPSKRNWVKRARRQMTDRRSQIGHIKKITSLNTGARAEHTTHPDTVLWSATYTRATYGGPVRSASPRGQAMRCGVCDTPELLRGRGRRRRGRRPSRRPRRRPLSRPPGQP